MNLIQSECYNVLGSGRKHCIRRIQFSDAFSLSLSLSIYIYIYIYAHGMMTSRYHIQTFIEQRFDVLISRSSDGQSDRQGCGVRRTLLRRRRGYNVECVGPYTITCPRRSRYRSIRRSESPEVRSNGLYVRTDRYWTMKRNATIERK